MKEEKYQLWNGCWTRSVWKEGKQKKWYSKLKFSKENQGKCVGGNPGGLTPKRGGVNVIHWIGRRKKGKKMGNTKKTTRPKREDFSRARQLVF